MATTRTVLPQPTVSPGIELLPHHEAGYAVLHSPPVNNHKHEAPVKGIVVYTEGAQNGLKNGAQRRYSTTSNNVPAKTSKVEELLDGKPSKLNAVGVSASISFSTAAAPPRQGLLERRFKATPHSSESTTTTTTTTTAKPLTALPPAEISALARRTAYRLLRQMSAPSDSSNAAASMEPIVSQPTVTPSVVDNEAIPVGRTRDRSQSDASRHPPRPSTSQPSPENNDPEADNTSGILRSRRRSSKGVQNVPSSQVPTNRSSRTHTPESARPTDRGRKHSSANNSPRSADALKDRIARHRAERAARGEARRPRLPGQRKSPNSAQESRPGPSTSSGPIPAARPAPYSRPPPARSAYAAARAHIGNGVPHARNDTNTRSASAAGSKQDSRMGSTANSHSGSLTKPIKGGIQMREDTAPVHISSSSSSPPPPPPPVALKLSVVVDSTNTETPMLRAPPTSYRPPPLEVPPGPGMPTISAVSLETIASASSSETQAPGNPAATPLDPRRRSPANEELASANVSALSLTDAQRSGSQVSTDLVPTPTRSELFNQDQGRSEDADAGRSTPERRRSVETLASSQSIDLRFHTDAHTTFIIPSDLRGSQPAKPARQLYVEPAKTSDRLSKSQPVGSIASMMNQDLNSDAHGYRSQTPSPDLEHARIVPNDTHQTAAFSGTRTSPHSVTDAVVTGSAAALAASAFSATMKASASTFAPVVLSPNTGPSLVSAAFPARSDLGHRKSLSGLDLAKANAAARQIVLPESLDRRIRDLFTALRESSLSPRTLGTQSLLPLASFEQILDAQGLSKRARPDILPSLRTIDTDSDGLISVEDLLQFIRRQYSLCCLRPLLSHGTASSAVIPPPGPVIDRFTRTQTLDVVYRALSGDLAVPDFEELCKFLLLVHRELTARTEGTLASFYRHQPPAGSGFGIAVCTVDGQVFCVGDSEQIPLGRTHRPFSYALAVDQHGVADIHNHVQRARIETLDTLSTSLPGPDTEAGAISVASALYDGLEASQRFLLVEGFFAKLAGLTSGLEFDAAHFDELCQRRKDRQNYLLYALCNRRAIKLNPLAPSSVLHEHAKQSLDLCMRVQCVKASCQSLAVMAGTLANSGTNPLTRQRCLSPAAVRHTLSSMATSTTNAGPDNWKGAHPCLAASSSGTILLVVPNVLGIAVFSPWLDAQGSSVRGLEVLRRLQSKFPDNFDCLSTALHSPNDSLSFPDNHTISSALEKNVAAALQAFRKALHSPPSRLPDPIRISPAVVPVMRRPPQSGELIGKKPPGLTALLESPQRPRVISPNYDIDGSELLMNIDTLLQAARTQKPLLVEVGTVGVVRGVLQLKLAALQVPSRLDRAGSAGRNEVPGKTEIEIRLYHPQNPASVGRVQCDALDSLDVLRARVLADLSSAAVPSSFVFMKEGVPIGRRQERRLLVEGISNKGVVVIKESVLM